MNRKTKTQGILANAFKVTTLKAKSISELMANLVYRSSARTSRATQRKPVLKN